MSPLYNFDTSLNKHFGSLLYGKKRRCFNKMNDDEVKSADSRLNNSRFQRPKPIRQRHKRKLQKLLCDDVFGFKIGWY